MADITDIDRGAVVKVAARQPTKGVDPKLTRKGGAVHRGGIVVSAAALTFFAYVFDLGGLQGRLNSSLKDLDRSARSHNGDVSAMVQLALPYVAVGMGVVALFFMMSLMAHFARAGSTKKKPKAAKKTVAPALAVEPVKEARPAVEAAVLVRPYRPQMPTVKLTDSTVVKPVVSG